MTKSAQPPPLSAVQLEVMNVIWERGDATITEVWEDLRGRRKRARATIQTVIQRLEEKGWLRHREVGQAFLFSAVHPRESVQGRLVRDLVNSAFGGAADGLVWALLHDRGVSPDEAKRIRQMIDDAEQTTRCKKGKKS